jgi:hypothetical protein
VISKRFQARDRGLTKDWATQFGGASPRIDEDPHLCARKIAQSLSLGIATSTFCHYLRSVIGMKCYHLRWIPHTLTVDQKVERQDLAKRTLEILAKDAVSNFPFPFTRDKSWLRSAYHVRTMWKLCPDNVDETQRASHPGQKTMLTVFSTAMACISLTFCLRIERRTQNTVRRILCHHWFRFATRMGGDIEHANMLCILLTHRYTIQNLSPKN